MASAVRSGHAGRAQEGRVQKDDRDALHEFAHCVSALRNLFYQKRPLDEAEFIFIDKSFEVLQMAYLRWKRRYKPTDELPH